MKSNILKKILFSIISCIFITNCFAQENYVDGHNVLISMVAMNHLFSGKMQMRDYEKSYQTLFQHKNKKGKPIPFKNVDIGKMSAFLEVHFVVDSCNNMKDAIDRGSLVFVVMPDGDIYNAIAVVGYQENGGRFIFIHPDFGTLYTLPKKRFDDKSTYYEITGIN